MCEQGAPFMRGHSNRCQNQAARYEPSESFSENHAGRIAITANKCKREGKPHVRRVGVKGHETYFVFVDRRSFPGQAIGAAGLRSR